MPGLGPHKNSSINNNKHTDIFFTTFWSQAFRWPQKWIFPLRSQHRCFTITTRVLSRDIEIEVNTGRGTGNRWFVRNLLKKPLFFCLNTSCQYSLQIIIKIYTFFTQVRKIHPLNVYEHNFEAILKSKHQPFRQLTNLFNLVLNFRYPGLLF